MEKIQAEFVLSSTECVVETENYPEGGRLTVNLPEGWTTTLFFLRGGKFLPEGWKTRSHSTQGVDGQSDSSRGVES